MPSRGHKKQLGGKGGKKIDISIICYMLSQTQFREVLLFFCLVFLLQTFTNCRTAGRGGGHFFNFSLQLPSASQAKILKF